MGSTQVRPVMIPHLKFQKVQYRAIPYSIIRYRPSEFQVKKFIFCAQGTDNLELRRVHREEMNWLTPQKYLICYNLFIYFVFKFFVSLLFFTKNLYFKIIYLFIFG